MTHQINILLLLLGALQGVILSAYLLRKQKAQLANIYFTLILLVCGLQLTFKVISKVWLMSNYRFPYVISYHLPYLIGPLLYLFIKARTSTSFKWLDLIHFIPFTVFVILAVLPFFNSGYPAYGGMTPYERAILQGISLCTYATLSWLIVNNVHELKGLKSFVIGLAGGEMVIIITLALMFVYFGRFPDVRLLFVALTLFIYWVSYKQLEHPGMFVTGSEGTQVKFEIQDHTKYHHSSLKAEEADRISSVLTHLMNHQRVYLNADLTIEMLAQQLGVSRHHVSQVINERFQLTYSDYINELRLDEVRSRLATTKYSHFTIAAIAMDSGFNSVSNFNELFKKKFGKTPSQFRKEELLKMSA